MPPAWEFFIATVLGIRDLMLQALVLLGIIKTRGDTTAQEHYPFEIATLTSEQTQYERSMVTGFPQVLADIAELRSYITSQDSGLLAAIQNVGESIPPDPTEDLATIIANIAALPAGSDIVIPSSVANAEDVWHYMEPGYPNEAWSRLESAGTLADSLSYLAAFPLAQAPGFYIQGAYNEYDTTPSVVHLPMPDYADLLPADTRLSWLQRTDTLNTWAQASGQSSPWAWANTQHNSNSYRIRPAFTEAQFDSWKGATAAGAAPIWPGIAGVTLGDTVPAVASTVLELPMDGMIWLTTSYPPARARWGAAPYYSVYHTGRLAFITDNGDLEPFQYMGWQNAVYVPQTMKRAAGVVVFLEANIEGAITPWDISV